MTSTVYTKVSELTALTNAASEDYLLIVDDPSGTPVSKRITVGNFANSILYNQTLNTTSNVTFGRVASSNGVFTSITFADTTQQTTAYPDFDQSLNTTDDVSFNSITSSNSALDSITFSDDTVQTTAYPDFDQSLNTTDNVSFNVVTSNVLSLANGTIITDVGDPSGENPSAGLKIGYGDFQIYTGSAANDWAILSGASLFMVQDIPNIQLLPSEEGSVTIGNGNVEEGWVFDANGITFPDSTVQTTAYSPSLTSIEIDGTTPLTGLQGADTIEIRPAIGYTGSDTHSLTFVGRDVAGKRTLIINASSLCTLDIDLGSMMGTLTVNPSTVVEVIYTGNDWWTISTNTM